MIRRLGVGLALGIVVLGCAAGEPAPPVVPPPPPAEPAGPSLGLETLAGTWEPIVQIDGVWHYEQECGSSSRFRFSGKGRVDGPPNCTFQKSAATAQGELLTVTGTTRRGQQRTLQFSWVDPAMPIAKIGCGQEQLYTTAKGLPTEDKPCLTLEAVAGTWEPVIHSGSEWLTLHECGVSTGITLGTDRVSGPDCSFEVSAAEVQDKVLTVTGKDGQTLTFSYDRSIHNNIGLASIVACGRKELYSKHPGLGCLPPVGPVAAAGELSPQAAVGDWVAVVQVEGEWRYAQTCERPDVVHLRWDPSADPPETLPGLVVQRKFGLAWEPWITEVEGDEMKYTSDQDSELSVFSWVDPAVPIARIDGGTYTTAKGLKSEARDCPAR